MREAIAGELLALRSLRLPDIEGIVFGLGRLAARADELPLRADLPANLASEADAELDAEPGLGRLWLAIKSTLLDLVRIERRDEPVPQALSAAERALAPPAARDRARARAHRRAARRRASVPERARDGDRAPAARLRRRGRPTSKARSRCSASCAASTSIPSGPTSAAR